MNFEVFSEDVSNLLINKGENVKDSILCFFISKLSEGQSSEILNQPQWWAAPIDYSLDHAHNRLIELKSMIYLLQGRFNTTYSNPLTVKRNLTQILREFHKIHVTKVVVSITDVYDCLHQNANLIEQWLDYEKPLPRGVVDLIAGIHTINGRTFLAKILSGPLIEDDLLLKILARHISAREMGTNIDKRLKSIYQTTLPDLGLIMQLLWENGIWRVFDATMVPGLPTRPERIKIFEKIEEVWKQTGPCYVQPKYYGWQVQIHKKDNEIWIFGRNLNDLTKQLPDLVEICRKKILAKSVILDGEIILPRSLIPRVSSYFETLSSTSHQIIIFDLLLEDEKDWRNQPYYKRRLQIMEILPDLFAGIHYVNEQYIKEESQLIGLWKKYIQDPDYQGIVVKLPSTPYHSASQSVGKWKVKNYTSLDLVILGYRKSTTFAIFTLGAWDSNRMKFVEIGVLDAVKEDIKINQTILQHCNGLEIDYVPENVIFSLNPLIHQNEYAGGVQKVILKPKIVLEVITNGLRVKDERYEYSNQFCLFPHDQKGYQERTDKSPQDVNTLDDFYNLKEAPPDYEQRYQFSISK